jgi:hypothetical protein
MNDVTTAEAKLRLDKIIRISRVDMYKPIQVAEVLYHDRICSQITADDLDSYRKESKIWRDRITLAVAEKKSSSSAKYQDDIWNDHAFPPKILQVLLEENRRKSGIIENYIYHRYRDRNETVRGIIEYVRLAGPESFELNELLKTFVAQPGIRRSIDKAYEIVTYSLLETVVTALKTRIKITVPEDSRGLLEEFSDLARSLLGVDAEKLENVFEGHIYRVGVTNAADRGLDMWANFGPAVQVKHITLDAKASRAIVDQVECDNIIIVCKDSDAATLSIISRQISWGQRVKAIVKQSDLVRWYEKCLRGKFKDELAELLLHKLVDQFRVEFPQLENSKLQDLLSSRDYKGEKLIRDWALD